MKESDQLATSFITPFSMYCYITVPFGLKNAGPTYQHCMQKCFGNQIDPPRQPDQLGPSKPTVAVYGDNIVVKAPRVGDLIATLDAMFANLRRFSIKLNPEKCTFGVPKGKLLGYIVSERGNEANLKKITAISRIGPIRNVKGVQRLTGCLAALIVSSSPDCTSGECLSTNSSRSRTYSSGRKRPIKPWIALKHC
jgi:hypothetical protein